MNTKEKIEVMQAHLDGEIVEFNMGVMWEELLAIDPRWDPRWDWANIKYRIKPKEKTKLYKYAYDDGSWKGWRESTSYYYSDADFESCNMGVLKYKRLDYTMIEVD